MLFDFDYCVFSFVGTGCSVRTGWSWCRCHCTGSLGPVRRSSSATISRCCWPSKVWFYILGLGLGLILTIFLALHSACRPRTGRRRPLIRPYFFFLLTMVLAIRCDARFASLDLGLILDSRGPFRRHQGHAARLPTPQPDPETVIVYRVHSRANK